MKTTAGANDTILRVDAALTSVSTFRSTLGAIQNRFQSTINSLSAVSENLSASRSRILDTDFAAETAVDDSRADSAAGWYGDGGAGELCSAERPVAAPVISVR